ncbi:MAG: PAS domain S-box protein [bacterium]
MKIIEKTNKELLQELNTLKNENALLKNMYEKDINERKQLEGALYENRKQLADIITFLPDATLAIDKEKRVIIWNKAIEEMTGVLAVEMIGKGDYVYTIPFYGEAKSQLMDFVFTNYNEDIPSRYYNVIRKTTSLTAEVFCKALYNNKGAWIFVKVSPLHDKDGNFIGAIESIRDITRQKHAEETLRQSENRYRELIELAADGILLGSSSGIIIGANWYMQNLCGRSLDNLIGLHISVLFEKNELNITPLRFDLLNEGRIVLSERKIICPDGKIIPIEMHTKKMPDGTYQSIFRNITERKLTEVALKESENKYRKLVENSPDGIVIYTEGKIVFVNNKSLSLLGATNENELIGKSVIQFVHPDYHSIVIARMKKAQTEGVVLPLMEEKFIKLDGSELYVEVKAISIVFENKPSVQLIISDITERKRVELERKVMWEITQGITTTSNLDELMELIHQSLKKVIYAENCFVVLYNKETGLFSFPYFVDQIDTKPEPMVMDKSCTKYVFNLGKPLLLTQVLFDELVEQNKVKLVGTNSPSWLGVPLQTPSGIIGVLVIQHYELENVYSEHDVRFLESVGNQIAVIIERKRTEEEIKLINDKLKDLNSTKDKFFSIIAHDLRSPFQGFLGLTQLLAEETNLFTREELSIITKDMHNSASNLFKLLENLLAWAQIQKGTISFTVEELDLRVIISRNIETINQRAKQKEITIINKIDNSIIINADEKMINSIISNLLSNAVKFTKPDGKIIVNAKEIEDKVLEISVTDSGVGMSNALLQKLFKIEEKVGCKGTDGEPSTGLGLLLCKEFVEKQNGKIWVKSEENYGSTFYFTVPKVF